MDQGSFARAAAVGFVAVSISNAFAATVRDDVSDAAVQALSASPQYAASGYVAVNDPGVSNERGSGVLLANNWVLTAAHVLQAESGAVPASTVTFGVGTSAPITGAGTYSVDQVIINPGWKGNFAAGNDIALLHLTSAVAGVTPATIYTPSLGSEKGLTGTLVGYGLTGNGTNGSTGTYDGIRRATTNVIDAFGGETVTDGNGGSHSLSTYSPNIFFEDFDNPSDPTASSSGATSATTYEGLAQPGDSGGGVYVNVGGTNYIAGIVSNGTAFSGDNNGGYGDLAYFTRVSQYTDFIDTYVNAPEPTSLSGLALLGLLGLRRRRGN